MFKNLLGVKVILFLIIAVIASIIIMKDFFIEKEKENYRYELTESQALPDDLEEISGMLHLDENRLIAVQDEDGYLFIYNLNTRSIEDKIKFGPGGDYESIAKVQDTIYVMRSDGKLFEISDVFGSVNVNTFSFDTNPRYNFEGLHYDDSKNLLLIAPKYKLKKSSDVKPIFGFDLSQKQFIPQPVFEINLKNTVFENHPEFMPASLTQDPQSGDFYMLDGRHRRLLLLDSNFEPKTIYKLSISELPQPESLSFYGDDMYISTEADRGILQHIYKIELDK
ncbi:MAG: hypothetical protein GVY05_00365 [Bacteroidetes bacterium]|nr:hypothetical protein [Bacteroidota bacterium]